MKNDLITGDICVTKKGEIAIILLCGGYSRMDKVVFRDKTYIPLRDYSEELKNDGGEAENDIVKVYRGASEHSIDVIIHNSLSDRMKLIWETPTTTK